MIAFMCVFPADDRKPVCQGWQEYPRLLSLKQSFKWTRDERGSTRWHSPCLIHHDSQEVRKRHPVSESLLTGAGRVKPPAFESSVLISKLVLLGHLFNRCGLRDLRFTLSEPFQRGLEHNEFRNLIPLKYLVPADMFKQIRQILIMFWQLKLLSQQTDSGLFHCWLKKPGLFSPPLYVTEL